MNSNYQPSEELKELLAALADEQLSEEQERRLADLLKADPQVRACYLDYMTLLTSLQWEYAEAAITSEPDASTGQSSNDTTSSTTGEAGQSARRFPGYWPRSRWEWGGLVAAALLVATVLWFARQPSGDTTKTPIATLVSVKNCKWEPGTLPTEVGSRLTMGRLRLAEGLARIVFDSGAEVTLESPAELELMSGERCVLHVGRLVARVPPQAVGFTIETPTAILKDLGTELGVHVQDAHTADVVVFKGRVDAQHLPTGHTQPMNAGHALRFTRDDIREFHPDSSIETTQVIEKETLRLSTAQGRGKDAYVESTPAPPRFRSSSLLLVKNTKPARANRNRKAYFAIDLTPVQGHQLEEAQLLLTFAPTGIGFSSEVADATFAVYGLIDETGDNWDEGGLLWKTAPANGSGGDALDGSRVMRVGSFEIAQGERTGTRTLSGPALRDFLKRDTNGLATFILVRETQGSGRNDLVHGFASKRHPTLTPPTLLLTVAPRQPK